MFNLTTRNIDTDLNAAVVNPEPMVAAKIRGLYQFPGVYDAGAMIDRAVKLAELVPLDECFAVVDGTAAPWFTQTLVDVLASFGIRAQIEYVGPEQFVRAPTSADRMFGDGESTRAQHATAYRLRAERAEALHREARLRALAAHTDGGAE